MWCLPIFNFGIFCHLLKLMGIYRVVAPVRVFGKFRSLFSFFFSFLFFIFFFLFYFVSLSGAPLAPGPLDIVHPCHPVATPMVFSLSENLANNGPWSLMCIQGSKSLVICVNRNTEHLISSEWIQQAQSVTCILNNKKSLKFSILSLMCFRGENTKTVISEDVCGKNTNLEKRTCIFSRM